MMKTGWVMDDETGWAMEGGLAKSSTTAFGYLTVAPALATTRV